MSSRICAEVQRHLPGYVHRTLPRLRGRLVAVHLRRCPACQLGLAHERQVSEGLAALAEAPQLPPDGLLDSLLEAASRPGVKGRVAVPARGAVSGARPGLSVALLMAGAAAGTGLGYAGWRGVRGARGRWARNS